MHEPLLEYLRSDAYRDEAELARESASYQLDRAALDARWAVESSALIGPADELSPSA